MKVLIDCEESQEVCKAFRAKGHEAYSCDIQDCSGGKPEWHIKGDAIITLWGQKWDLVIAHPPCTYLANSGVRWLISKKKRYGFIKDKNGELYINPDRMDKVIKAARFFKEFKLYGELGGKIAIEQPIMHKYAKEQIFLSGENPQPSQIIQPWQFGHGESKATCLWLYNLPILLPTEYHFGREQRIWKIPPGPDRQKQRSKTFPGIAKAMADQWG